MVNLFEDVDTKGKKGDSTSVRLAADIHNSVKTERNRIYAATGNEPGMVTLLENAWRFYLSHRDRIVTETRSGQVKVETTIDKEDMDRLRERSAAQGFASAKEFLRYLIEREVAGEHLDLESLSPDEAEIARAVVELYRNPDPKHPIATLFAGFFTFLKNQVAQKKLVK